jgi:hypothetical protein
MRASPVRIQGATGPSGPSINGIYEPTDEICGGWPVYKKREDTEKWLEYIVATNEWYVKPTSDKGKAEGWMCIASEPPSRPELSKGTTDVWDGERWTTQTTVEIIVLPGYFRTMTDVQIFCNEEIKKSHDKFATTLTKTIQMLSSTITEEKIEKGTNQMDEINKEFLLKIKNLYEVKDNESKQLLATTVINTCINNISNNIVTASTNNATNAVAAAAAVSASASGSGSSNSSNKSNKN